MENQLSNMMFSTITDKGREFQSPKTNRIYLLIQF